MLRGKTMEEIVNRWTSDLETNVREFNKFAAEVAVWDRALIENGNNVSQHCFMVALFNYSPTMLLNRSRHYTAMYWLLRSSRTTSTIHCSILNSNSKILPPLWTHMKRFLKKF